jgi:hypothetical protein
VDQGGGLARVLAGGEAVAAVPHSLLEATSKAAVLAAAGQLAVNATTASALTHEVMKAMFLTKLKAAVARLVLMAALGAAGIATSLSGGPAVQAQAPPAAKPASSEVEALRREIELLKLNLRVTLEKLDAMEKRQGDKAGLAQQQQPDAERELKWKLEQIRRVELERAAWQERNDKLKLQRHRLSVAVEIETLAKELREAKDPADQEKLIKALDQAIRKLQDVRDPATNSGKE